MTIRLPITTVLLSGLLFSTTASAGYTLSSLLGELTQDVTVVTQKGTCAMNPYPTDSFSGEPINPPCAPVVATCPRGKIPLTGALSSCQALPSLNQADITQILEAYNTIPGYPTFYRYGNPVDINSLADFNLEQSNTTGKSQCGVGIKPTFNQASKPGYTPWCFFTRPGMPDSPLFPSISFINNSIQTRWTLGDGTVLTSDQLNNPSNYNCYPIDYQLTARCVTAPAATSLNKLGIKLK